MKELEAGEKTIGPPILKEANSLEGAGSRGRTKAIMNRRKFLKLSGGAVGSIAVVPSFLTEKAMAVGSVDCIEVSGGTRQKRLEAMMNVMLPGSDTHGTTGPGILDVVLYGKNAYEHMIDPWFDYQINQDELDDASGDLGEAALCFDDGNDFWDLTCENQLGALAYATRRGDEGAAPNLSLWEELCLWLGAAFGLVSTSPDRAFDLARWTCLIFYCCPAGLAYLEEHGYKAHNGGYNYLSGAVDWPEMPFAQTSDLTVADLTNPCLTDTGTCPPSIHQDTL